MEKIVLRNIDDCDKALVEVIKYKRQANEPEKFKDKLRELAITRCGKERGQFYGQMSKQGEFDYIHKHSDKFFPVVVKRCKKNRLYSAIMSEIFEFTTSGEIIFDPLHYLDTVDQDKLPPHLKGPRFPPRKKTQENIEE
jgi:hypothetical protein